MNLFERHARLNQLFQQSPVDAAYLSGSLASRASFGEMTSVDIAILLTEQIASDRFLDYQFYFLSELTKRLESESLDVVILNQASLLLRLQIIKYGQILYSRDEKKRSVFEARTVLDYLDFRQMDELQNKAIARRLHAPVLGMDRERIALALARLDDAHALIAAELGGAEAVTLFATDVRLQAVVDRSVLLAIESMAQVATLLYAALSLSPPEQYADLLLPLAKRDIVAASVVAQLGELAAQRDTLLRTPEELDRDKLFALISASLPNLATFAAAVRHFLGDPGQ